jgi:hypothetical protein
VSAAELLFEEWFGRLPAMTQANAENAVCSNRDTDPVTEIAIAPDRARPPFGFAIQEEDAFERNWTDAILSPVKESDDEHRSKNLKGFRRHVVRRTSNRSGNAHRSAIAQQRRCFSIPTNPTEEVFRDACPFSFPNKRYY